MQPVEQKFVAPETNSGMPIRAGRQSIPTVAGIDGLTSTTILPDVPFQYLELLQQLASINPDISYAVENIVQLGSTPYTIDFGDSVSEADAAKMRKVLNDASRQWYGNFNSRAVLVANMLDQIVVNGALSMEAVIEPDLSGIQSVVLPNPKNIEFKYNKETLTWDAYQRVSGSYIGSKLVDGALVRLNPNTYKYYPIRNRSEKPYGVPPFLSAIEMTSVEFDVLANFQKVAKNIGIMGFLEILVNRPPRQKSSNGEWMETDTEYNARCVAYLESVIRPEAEKGFTTGVMTGFKSDFEMKFQSNNSTNINGAEKFVEMLTVQKHAGLKQDPILLGRPFNTSEALGRVILDKFASQVTSFQEIVACGLAELFKLELVLKGFPVMDVFVVFERPSVKDEKSVEEAYGQKIDNLDKLYNQGIITQTQRANELGYDTPAEDSPLATQQADTTNVANQNNNLAYELGDYYEEFDYGDNTTCCEHHHFTGDDGNDNLDKYINGYLSSMTREYKRFVNKVTLTIAERVISMRKSSSKQEVFDAVYNTVLRGWGSDFKPNQKSIISKWLDAAYKSFRTDKNIFGKDKIKDKDGNITDIPKGTLDTIDLRTLSYMRKADELYMGKFITDRDTVKRLRDFIYAEFEKGDIPLGQTAGQKAFIENMANTLNIEQFKIERIVRTTTNKLRSYASVNYMHQVGVNKFQVLALIDNKTSDICRKMNGKEFSVPASRARIVQVSKSEPSSVPRVTPFVSSIFKTDELDQLDDLTGADLLSEHGIFAPPYHGNCRTQIIAIL